jgi:hypothetical protein
MKRLVVARMILTAIGIFVWSYGNDDERMRLAGMAIIAVAVALRFVPKRWFDTPPE